MCVRLAICSILTPVVTFPTELGDRQFICRDPGLKCFPSQNVRKSTPKVDPNRWNRIDYMEPVSVIVRGFLLHA